MEILPILARFTFVYAQNRSSERSDSLSVVWTVVDSSTASTSNLFSEVMQFVEGNVPVRRFASLEAMEFFLASGTKGMDIVAVLDTAQAITFLSTYSQLPGVLRVAILTGKSVKESFSSYNFECKQFIYSDKTGQELLNFINAPEMGRKNKLITCDNVSLDIERLECHVTPDGKVIPITVKEGRLLKLFFQNRGVTLQREHIRSAVWENVKVAPRTMDSQISRLRQRLRETSLVFESVYGGGYILR